MRKSTFASIAALALSVSLALTGCQVGDEGDGGGGGGGDPKPDAGGGNPVIPDAGGAQACPPNEAEFKTQVFDVAMAPFGCANGPCHGTGVPSFPLSTTDQAANRTAAIAKATKLVGGKSVLLVKPTSADNHGGGQRFAEGSAAYLALEKFVGQVNGVGCN